MFFHKHSVGMGLFCDGTFVDIRCCPLEIFLIKKPKFLFLEKLRDTVND